MIPYYFTGMPWKDYLQSRVTIQGVDYSLRTVGSRMSGDVGRSGKAITYALAESTKQIVASDREIADTLQRGFSGLEQKLGSINQTLGDVRASIEDFHAAFNYGIGLVLDQLVLQNGTLEQISETLYGIKETLSTPMQTRAQEFFTIGCSALSKGLLDKAADYFQKAVTEYDLHLLAHFNLGKLYLYGKDDENDLIDVPKAEEALRAALKLAKAEARVNPKANKLAAETLFHLSMSCYLKAQDKAQDQEDGLVEDIDEVLTAKAVNIAVKQFILTENLEEALNFALEASVCNPQFSEAYYQAAKCSSMLGDIIDKEKYLRICLDNLDIALYYDPNYAIKVALDRDFDGIRGAVDILLRNKRDALKQQADALMVQISTNLKPLEIDLISAEELYEPYRKLVELREQCDTAALDHAKVDRFFSVIDIYTFPYGTGNDFIKKKYEKSIFERGYTRSSFKKFLDTANSIEDDFKGIKEAEQTFLFLLNVLRQLEGFRGESEKIRAEYIKENRIIKILEEYTLRCKNTLLEKLAIIEERKKEKLCLICGENIGAWKRFTGHTLVCC